MSGWPRRPLSDVLELQRGHDLPAPERRSGPVPIIGSFGVTGTHNQAKYPGPGVAIGRSGAAFGTATYVAEAYWPLNTCLFVRDFKGNDPRWVFHLLDTMDFGAFNSGSAQPSLNRNFLRNISVPVPALSEQRSIAEVLGALDDKIAANTKLVASLSENLEASFTSVMRESEGFIPFSDLAYVTKGVSYRSIDLVASRTALVTLKSFDRSGGYSARGLKDYAGPYKPVQQVFPGEIVVAQTDLTQAAEVVGRAIRVPASRNHETLVASLDLAIVRPMSGIPVEFMLGLMLQGRFRAHCKSRTSGTTVLHLASTAIPTFRAPRVSAVVQQRYASIALPMLEMSDSLTRESEALLATRDALLPPLMSGKLRVRDAEKVLEGVL
jgi:type I restriction enzyme S subunit